MVDRFAGDDPSDEFGGASPRRAAASRPGGSDADDGEDGETVLGEPSPLGAAEPITIGREPKKRGTGGPSKVPHFGRWGIVLAVVLVLLALTPLIIGGLKKTPRDRVAISYGGGPIEGVHFQRLVQPGSSLFFNGVFDSLYLYPSDQVNYIISKQVGVGANKGSDSIVAPTNDRVQVTYQVAVYFKLNTDLLRQFHEQLGLRYKAYTNSGWDDLINDTFRQQIESALQEETRRVAVAELFGSADQLVKVQNAVQTKLTQQLKAATGNEFFCSPTYKPGGPCGNPTFVIKKIDVPASVATAFEDNRTSSIQILTKQNQIRQREAEAEAIAALDLTGEEYARLRAVEEGKTTFWVVPGGTGINLTAPSAAGAAPTPIPTPTTAPTSTTTTATQPG